MLLTSVGKRGACKRCAFCKRDESATPQAKGTPARASVTRIAGKTAVSGAEAERRRGLVRRMQAGLATAVADDKDWQEF